MKATTAEVAEAPVATRIRVYDIRMRRLEKDHREIVAVKAVKGVEAVAAVPEVPAELDDDGNVVTPGVEAVPAVQAVEAVEGVTGVAARTTVHYTSDELYNLLDADGKVIDAIWDSVTDRLTPTETGNCERLLNSGLEAARARHGV